MEFSFLNLKYVLLWFLLNTTNVDPISYVVLFSLVLIYIFSMIFIKFKKPLVKLNPPRYISIILFVISLFMIYFLTVAGYNSKWEWVHLLYLIYDEIGLFPLIPLLFFFIDILFPEALREWEERNDKSKVKWLLIKLILIFLILFLCSLYRQSILNHFYPRSNTINWNDWDAPEYLFALSLMLLGVKHIILFFMYNLPQFSSSLGINRVIDGITLVLFLLIGLSYNTDRLIMASCPVGFYSELLGGSIFFSFYLLIFLAISNGVNALLKLIKNNGLLRCIYFAVGTLFLSLFVIVTFFFPFKCIFFILITY